jgi:UDP-2,3-diacylglucosamine pyrophosphatase LpxH
MIYLSVSDFHLGKGKFLSGGQKNLIEDFFEDDDFKGFLEFYSTGDYKHQAVTLVLNGDIFNLIQIDHLGIFTDLIDEGHVLRSIEKIKNGHEVFFNSLRDFNKLEKNKVVFTIGNHDAGLVFEKAQKYLCEILGQVDVVLNYECEGIYFEHGHRFEVINATPASGDFIDGADGNKYLNLPWGSLFCVNVLPLLKKERPFIDRVRPLTSYVIWCLFHDFLFFLTLVKKVIGYILRTRDDEYTKGNRHYKTTLAILKQITIYPKYGAKARSILKKRKDLRVVVMGHTHLVEWRRYPEGQLYFNTGTWNPIPNVDAGMHQERQQFTYLKIETLDGKIQTAGINKWRGVWKPYSVEVSLDG